VTKWVCNSCKGVYEDQPGGYYHACPSDTKEPRDENIDDSKPVDPSSKKHPIKSEGSGRKKTT